MDENKKLDDEKKKQLEERLKEIKKEIHELDMRKIALSSEQSTIYRDLRRTNEVDPFGILFGKPASIPTPVDRPF